jgi:hypothetical protein
MRKNIYLTLFLTALLALSASAQESEFYWGLDKRYEASATDVSSVQPATAYNWQEISLPYAETLAFSEENTVQVGYSRGFAFKFVLANPALIYFYSNEWPEFAVYRDEECQDKVFSQIQSKLDFLPAGTYYLTIATWNTSLIADISITAFEPQSIDFAYSGAFSLTASMPVIEGNAALVYAFETSVAQLVNFSATADKKVAVSVFDAGSLMDVTNSNYLLGAGKHIVVVRAQEDVGAGVTGNLQISANTSYAIAEIESLPYQADFSITQSNSVNIAQRQTQIYSFTLPEVRPIRIKWTENAGKSVTFNVYDESGKLMTSNGQGTLLANSNYPVGKYFLQIIDRSNLIADGSTLAGNFKLEILKNHVDVDYSEILTEAHKIIGSSQTMSDIVFEAGANPLLTKGFSFNTEAGKLYELKWQAWSSKSAANWGTGITTMKNELTGEYIAKDRIIAYSGWHNNTDSGEGILMFKATETATVKGAFTFVTLPGDADVMFDLTIKEVPLTYTEPSTGGTGLTWDEITLPFRAYLHFDPAYPGVGTHNGSEVARGFKLILTEKTEVSYDYGIDHTIMSNFNLCVYKDAALTECVVTAYACRMSEKNKVVLDAGTYYIVFTDGGTSQWAGKYLSGTCMITGKTDFIEETVLSLPEFLNSDIPVVAYNDLTYSNASYYIDGISATVKGETDLFRYNGNNYYAVACKLTGMQAGDSVAVTQSGRLGDDIFVFTKAENGTFVQDTMKSANWVANDQYKTDLFFKADAATDYYIVVSPGSTKQYVANKSPYSTIIWKYGSVEEPQPQLPQLPDKVKIVGTQASAGQIAVPSTASDEQILTALAELGITGRNVLNENVTLKNNPYCWVISQDGRSASFVNIGIPYETADNYTGAVVEFTNTVGLSKISAVTVKVAPNPAKEFVTVFGLQGGETIRIFDISARLVSVQIAKTADQQISVTNLKAGVYTVQISGGGQTQAVKLIVKP